MNNYITGKDLKAAMKDAESMTIWFSDKWQTLEITKKGSSMSYREGIRIDLKIDYSTGLKNDWYIYASDLPFFLDSLRPTDKILFSVEDRMNGVLAEQLNGTYTIQILIARIRRYKSDGTTLAKQYEVTIDSRYIASERANAPISPYFLRLIEDHKKVMA